MGGACFKWTSPGTDGVPDRIVILPDGRVIFVELKTETGRLSPVQEYQIRRLEKLHQTVRVLHGADEVKEFLQEVAR